jgi:hypothetical protein
MRTPKCRLRSPLLSFRFEGLGRLQPGPPSHINLLVRIDRGVELRSGYFEKPTSWGAGLNPYPF